MQLTNGQDDKGYATNGGKWSGKGNGNRNSSNGLIMNVNNTEAVLAQGTLSEGPGRGSPSIGGNVHNGLTCPRW